MASNLRFVPFDISKIRQMFSTKYRFVWAQKGIHVFVILVTAVVQLTLRFYVSVVPWLRDMVAGKGCLRYFAVGWIGFSGNSFCKSFPYLSNRFELQIAQLLQRLRSRYYTTLSFWSLEKGKSIQM